MYHFFLFLSFALLKNRHTYFILSTQCLFDGVAVVVVVVDGAAAAAVTTAIRCYRHLQAHFQQ